MRPSNEETCLIEVPQRIFAFRPARDVWFVDGSPLTKELLDAMEEGTVCSQWNPPKFYKSDEFPNEPQVLSDVVELCAFTSVFSLRACVSLKRHFIYGQLLPIFVSDQNFFVYKPLVGCQTLNVNPSGKSPFYINLSWSDVLLRESPTEMPRLTKCTNFHMTRPRRFGLFVTAEFVADVLAAGLRGIDFAEVEDFDYV